MLTVSRARIIPREATKLVQFARKASRHLRFTLLPEVHRTSRLQERTVLNRTTCRLSSMADSGEKSTPIAGGAGGGAEASGGGEPVVKSAKQLKKDAKKKEKLEKFQQKQAKMAAGQQKQNNSGSEVRNVPSHHTVFSLHVVFKSRAVSERLSL